jgi:hypothetical protein
MSGSEHYQPAADGDESKSQPEAKHWLEYAIFIFVILTAVGTIAAAWYTRQQ